MKSLVPKALRNEDEFITIVSGLPRSGTSMMMQMLEAGGMAIVTDHIRKPDKDNPRGYYEFEMVRKIEEDASWVKETYGKAFKMVSALLYYLPKNEQYRIIFMRRQLDEMLRSQYVMLQRLGHKRTDVSDEEVIQKFKWHLWNVREWLARQKNMEVLYVYYDQIIDNPQENATLVNRFLGGRLDNSRMVAAVDTSLYRQRNSQ